MTVNWPGANKRVILSARETQIRAAGRGITMASTTGTIKRKTDKGFGFIAAPDGTEYFFHHSGCVGTRFDDLREGQTVSFTVGQGPKGPRAENVKPE
jgi:CspA family cold shock protein